jgi:F-type H+-transporting ATPase subunit delta
MNLWVLANAENLQPKARKNMLNPRLAGRYAKSLIGLSIEKNQLESVYKDMLYLQSICKSNRDFVSLLKSPIIKGDKKQTIMQAVTDGKISEMTAGFNRLLIKKGRESNLPEIVTAFIEQYKNFSEIHTIKLTTASPISEELKQEIVSKVRSQTPMKNVEVVTEVNGDLIGGFVLQIGDILIDSSIIYDLNTIRKQFLNNDFIYKIR